MYISQKLMPHLQIYLTQLMESQSQVAEISPPVDCNHRISQLYCHRRCSKNAQICEKGCKARAGHDVPWHCHEKTTVRQLKLAFSNLEEPCEKQTEHYVRQIHQIERKANETIALKKRQCLNQIEILKKAIMMKTYTDLESEFPHLYEKYKGDRFDALNCKQVFWIMKSNRSFHSLKHSQINAKLESILKKFQNFKDVSKNIKPSAIIFSKEKAKTVKIMEKMPEPVIKVKQNITLEKPDYSEDRYGKFSKDFEQLCLKKRELQESIRFLSSQKSKLTDQVNGSIYLKRQRKERLKIISQTVRIQISFQIIFPWLNLPQVRLIDNPIASQQCRQEEMLHSNEKIPMIPYPSSRGPSQQNEDNINSKEEHLRNSISHESENASIQPQHDKEENNVINEHEELDKENLDHEQQNMESSEQKRQGDLQVMNQQKESNQNHAVNDENQQVSIPKPPDSASQRLPQQPKVKVQFDEHEGFEPWKNIELLEQMKKYGKSQPQCLKVENIDGSKSFPKIRLNPSKAKINPLLKNVSAHKAKASAPYPFNLYAMQLLEREIKRKTEKKDKTPE